MDKPDSYQNKEMPLTHDREFPLIAIVSDLQPVTQDILKIYRVEASEVTLENIGIKNNRENFKQFDQQNYIKLLYKESRATSKYMHESTKKAIEKEFEQVGQDVSKEIWYNTLGKSF